MLPRTLQATLGCKVFQSIFDVAHKLPHQPLHCMCSLAKQSKLEFRIQLQVLLHESTLYHTLPAHVHTLASGAFPVHMSNCSNAI